MKLSILIPTLFPDQARAAIDALRPQLTGIAHEFVVVSPHEISGQAIIHVPELESRGPTAAHHAAFARARGEIVLVAADDIRFASTAIAETMANFADPRRPVPLVTTYPRIVGHFAMAHVMYGRVVPTFFAIGRADVTAAGGWFDPQFVAVFGDYDLGFRAIAAGGKVRLLGSPFQEVIDRAGTPVAPAKKSTAPEEDFRRFRAKWGSAFDPAWGEAEHGINLLVPARFLPLVSAEPDCLNIDGLDAVRDLRVLARLALASLMDGADMPAAIAAGALAYLGWVGRIGDNPRHVAVCDGTKTFIARPKG
ncbi:MAG: glycosyltransferase family 2 protein [Tagaea sp.]